MKTKKSVDPSLSLIAGLLGARGGSVKTPAKTAASRENVKKATAARLARIRRQAA